MKKTMILLALLLGGYGLMAQENDPQLLKIVHDLGDKMAKLVVDENLEELVDMYGENAQYLPDRAGIFTGLDEIKGFWKQTFQVDILEFKLNTKAVQGDKKRIFETGTGYSVALVNGNKATFKFKFVNVWERVSGGEYKLVIDIYNRDVE